MSECLGETCLTSDGTSSRFPVSILIERQLPQWAVEDHPKFLAFLEAYYEWMELAGNPYAEKYCLMNNLDVDTTVDAFLDFFKREYLYNIPEELYSKSGCESTTFFGVDDVYDYEFPLPTNNNSEITVTVNGDEFSSSHYSIRSACGSNSRILFDDTFAPVDDGNDPAEIEITVCENIAVDIPLLIKTIKQLNVSKGTEASYRLLFKLLFNEDIEIKYPSELLLIASDGKWVKGSTIEITKNIPFTIQSHINTQYPVSGTMDTIHHVTVDGTDYLPASGAFTIERGVLYLQGVGGSGDMVTVYYKDFGGVLYGTPETFNYVTDRIFVTSSNITPAPTQSDVRLKRFRGLAEVIIDNEFYKIIEVTDAFGVPKTGFVISDVYDLQSGVDIISFELKSNIVDDSGISTGESWTIDETPVYEYNLGLWFDPVKSSPTMTRTNEMFAPAPLNIDTIIEDFTGITTNEIVLTTDITAFGYYQFGLNKNGEFLSNANYMIDQNANTITLGTPLLITDTLTVTMSPAYTLEERVVSGQTVLFCVFDSSTGIIWDESVVLSYKSKPISGAFKNNDGQLSSTPVLQDSHKYQQFSYIIKSEHTTDQYAEYLKNLLHPAGMIMFGEIMITECISWMINHYQYYINIADIQIYSSSNGTDAPFLGPRWRSFDINKFQYGLTSQGLSNTQILSIADESLNEVLNFPDNKINFLLDSHITSYIPFPPFFIGGSLTPMI